MFLVKIKAKNQVTLPQAVIDELQLKTNDFLRVDIRDNYIRLIPVTIQPRYVSANKKKKTKTS